MALDRSWLRQMMVEESLKVLAEILAKDRNPMAAAIEREARRATTDANLREGIDNLRSMTQDPEEARRRWSAMVGPEIRRSIADLRPN